MYRILPLLIIIFLCASVSVFGQNPSPTPVPTDEGDVVKISTNLIQIDVTVTDKKGNPIRDLRRDEVEIYENGKLQPISNFSFVSNVKQTEAKRDDKSASARTVLPSAAPRPEQIRRTIALVVDDLTLSFASTFWVREALKKFVDEQMREGDLVAIIRTVAGVGALQQFTNDKRQLYAAIQRIRFNLGGSGRIGAFSAIEPSARDLMQNRGDDRADSGSRDGNDIEREANDFRQTIFANGTLGALNFIVRGMSDLPGRKSVMLLSDGFALFSRDERGVPTTPRILDSLRRLTDLANRASVVIYTLDAKGLQVGGLTAEDNTSGMTSEQIESRLTDRRNEIIDTQEGLNYLAKQTGGFAIINQNDISKGIRRVLDDQSYYLVGYEPDDDTFDPKTRRFNKLEIKVKRPGTRVRYRSGFFGISEEQITRPKVNATTAIINALTSPFAINDVTLRMNAIFASDDKQGAYVRSFINVDASDLTFKREADGKYKTVFDLVALTFGDNGNVLDERARTFAVTLSEDEYRKLLKRGLVSNFTLPVKKPGGYQVRVAIRDAGSEKVGSANQFVEIPNLKKNRLTISGVVLESFTLENWQRIDSLSQAELMAASDPQLDTAVRQFKPGSVLRFAYDIYNFKRDGAGIANLTYQLKLFRDGTPVFEGKAAPVVRMQDESPRKVSTGGTMRLGQNLAPGEYILQIDITDSLAKESRRTATQFVQFEVVK